MRPVTELVVVLLAVGMCMFGTVATGSETSATPTRGKVIGARISTYPEWFGESFLEIAEDAETAGQQGKHVILFFDSEGCPYCYKMIEENFKHSPYTSFIKDNFHTIPFNIRGDREVAFSEDLRLTEKELARQLNIHFTPTMLFLDSHNKAVLRIDGYRSVAEFKYLLDYVEQMAYHRIGLVAYLEQQKRPTVYALREHPNFESLADLSATDKPLMVIFEDDTCGSCDALHDNILSRPSTQALMDQMTVVRLDARSRQPLVDATGRATTAANWGRDLDLSYRPGIVMFDQGQEVFRIDAWRKTFHFQQALRYVTGRQWRHYQRYNDFARADRDAILDSGQDVDVWE